MCDAVHESEGISRHPIPHAIPATTATISFHSPPPSYVWQLLRSLTLMTKAAVSVSEDRSTKWREEVSDFSTILGNAETGIAQRVLPAVNGGRAASRFFFLSLTLLCAAERRPFFLSRCFLVPEKRCPCTLLRRRVPHVMFMKR